MIRENFKNIAYQTSAQILPRAMLFVFTFYLAAKLGSTEYGKYDFSMSIGYLVGVFFELGGNVILTKYVARGFYSSYIYSLKFRAVSIISTFIVVFSYLLISGMHSAIFFHVLAACIGIAFSSLMNLNFAFFRGLKRMNYEAIVLIIQKILFIGLSIIFLLRSDSSIFPLISFALSMVISWIIIQWIFIRERHKYNDNSSDKSIQFKEYLKDVMSLALVEVFSVIYFRATQIILEQFHGFSEVGKYSASYKLVEALTNVPSILMLVLFPVFAKLSKENLFEFKRNFNKALVILFVLGFISCVFCWFLGQTFFSIIGKDYDQSYIIIRYMCPALFMIFPNYLLTQSLIAVDKNILYAKIVFIALIVNIFLALLLVPSYGAIGSAISVGICELLIFTLTYYNIRNYLRKNG
ncbi:MAG: flippase [Ignavibacteria bacterium]|nr:flippase [Ignavibacteria bacterium]